MKRLQCIQHSVTFTTFANANTVKMDTQTLLNKRQLSFVRKKGPAETVLLIL